MKFLGMFILGLVMVVGVLLLARAGGDPSKISVANPTPTGEQVQQLAPADQPKVSLAFKADGHYATVKITNLKSNSLEYNLIYDADVYNRDLKKNVRIQTGVTDNQKLNGANSYTKEQLLGSVSSGKTTYHENIANGIMELTLRDTDGRSIFSASYPFTITPGKSIDLTASNQ